MVEAMDMVEIVLTRWHQWNIKIKLSQQVLWYLLYGLGTLVGFL